MHVVMYDIPEEIQVRYNIDERVEAQLIGESDESDVPMGGVIEFRNLAGKNVRIDAVEIYGKGIRFRPSE